MEDNPTRTIKLFCWILDVSKESFAVFIKESQTVFDLKQEILVMKRQRLPDVVRDTEDLAVWNVSIVDKSDLKEGRNIDQYVDKEALPPERQLSDIFSSAPAKEAISIVVRVRAQGVDGDQRPAKRIRIQSPNPFEEENRVADDKPLQHTPSKSLAEVKDIIHQILQRYRPTIQALVTKAGIDPLIPPWTPNPEMSDTVEMTFKNHIQALAIPSVEGLPSLLLHDLGSETSAISRKQAKYMTGIFSLEYHTVLINTSGSGKTRLGLHGLCKYWGFYGVANQVLDGIGSKDFWQLMVLEDSPSYCLTKKRGSQNAEAELHMRQKVKHRVMQFFLSRFLLLNVLITEASKCEGGLRPSDHRLLWVLLQARPTDLLQDDAFNELSKALRVASIEDLEAQTKEEYIKLKKKGILNSGNHPVTGKSMHRPLYFFLDEIQTTTSSRMGEYLSDDKKTKRPLLRPLWQSVTKVLPPTEMRVILSGTAINETSLKNALASSANKFSPYIIKRDIGAFDDSDAQRQYLERYLPGEESAARHDFLRRAWGWCRGRYRNTATLIELILATGPNSPHKILDKFVKSFTNFSPTDGEMWYAAEPDVEDFHLEKLDFDRMGSRQIEALCNVLYGQMVYGCFHLTPFAPEDDIKALIEYGFARTRSGEDVLDEPLAIMAAWNWLEDKDHFSLLDCLQQEIGKHAPRKNAFEAYLAFYLRKVFEKNARLNDVFIFRSDFASKSDLSWQAEEFELVSVSKAGTDEQKISIVTPSRGPSPNVGLLAQTNDDVLNWVSNNEEGYAFCFPTESAGPDFFFFVRSKTTGSLLLVALQAKHYEVVKKQTLIDGVRTVTPSFFWKSKDEVSNGPSGVASDFCNALMKIKDRITIADAPYPVLRVFASWKADAKLERTLIPKKSKGGKARKPRAKVDKNSIDVPDRDLHPLATLHLENFNRISHWLTKSRYRGDTEQAVVVFAKDQYDDEEKV